MGDLLKYPVMRTSLNFATIYAYLSIPVRSLIIHLYILGLYLVSAGPVGNFQTNTPPPFAKIHRRRCSIIFYMMQTILWLPGLCIYLAPVIGMIVILVMRLWNGPDEKWSDFRFIALGFLVFELQVTFYEVFQHQIWALFPYIEPTKFPRKVWKGIVWVIEKIKAPFNRARKGLTHYIQVAYQFLKSIFSSVYEFIAKGVKCAASFVYTLTKGVLQGLWEVLKFIFDIIFVKILGSIASAYFGIFRFVLKILKPLGIIGELMFTLYGLAWLLWPLGLSYFIQKEYGHPEVWVGGVIISVIFIVKGRQIIIEE